MKKALVTGVTGQDGIYLTQLLLKKGYQVVGTTSQSMEAPSVQFLKSISPGLEVVTMSMVDYEEIVRTISEVEPDEIYNLASISSVAQSIMYPELTQEVNGEGPIRILRAISALKLTGSVKLYQASSSEMFGQAKEFPQKETTSLNPISPYAISKAFAHSKCGLARDSGVFVACGITFNHESPYRGETFVSKKICRGVAEISLGLKKTLTLGSLEPKRDWGYAGDYVEAMWAMLQCPTPEDFVVSTGQSRSIRDFLQVALHSANQFNYLRDYVNQDPQLLRKNELSSTVGDPSKAFELLNWKAETTFESMIQMMIKHEIQILAEK
jgi:GDPmannose 4,6-dehydratase